MKMKKKKAKFKPPYRNKKYRFMFEKDYVPHKYNILYGGTGSSKSFSMWSMLVQMCLQYSTFDILIARKYATTLHDTVEIPIVNIMTKYFRNVLSGNGLLEGRDFTYNRTHKHIRFSTGSIIRMKGYDNPEKLKGIDNVNVLVLEEVTDFTQEDLEDIQDRLRGTPPDNHPWGNQLKVFLLFNPIFKTHWIRPYFFNNEIDMSSEVHEDTVIDPINVMALKTTWRDNKYYNGQYKDKSLRDKMQKENPRKYGVQCNGNWGVLGELIYENYEIGSYSKNVYDYDDYSIGCDFGFGHKTAIHLVCRKGRDIYVIKETYRPKMTANDIIAVHKREYNQYRTAMICDNARPEMIEEMQRQGVLAEACIKGANSVLEGIEWLQDRRIFFDESCVGAIEEAQTYQWEKDKRTGERLPKPIKSNDDAMDDIRYGSQKFKTSGKIDFAS
jgi:phage terminase large subunit